ncbi:MAG: ABC transporter ATP-binding protein [Verrucomicrobiales bacterium]|nr:ABC transporter ATP-binding protein [Verrucomicrobiales bacterium]
MDNVSLKIEAGEVFFLLGPSGCGKTTLLRHIAGFYTPDDGHLFFDMQEITHLPAHRRNAAMMFQSYALWPHMSVAKNVAFGLEERRVDLDEIEERVTTALETVHMEAYADRKPNQLSGGQQQRVALARSLVVRPQCLLLDEPLSNLDAKLRTEMRTEIRRIVKEFGLTAVYVTHDQKEALSIADRMAIMEDGRIAQVGTPVDIYQNPHSKSVADFIGESNFIEGIIEGDTSREHLFSVSTPHGRFWGRRGDENWSPARGEKISISIRPECVYLTEEAETRNCIHGKLADSVYLGEIAQYVLHAKDGTPIRISQMNPVHMRSPSSQPVYAYAEPEDVVILRH